MGSSCKGGKAQSTLTIVAQQPNVDIRAINEDPVGGTGGYLHHEVFYLKGCTCGIRLCNSIKSNHPTVSISSLGRRGWVRFPDIFGILVTPWIPPWQHLG